jgi:enoyl-CoA hydratase/carnithine racemase
VNGIFSKLDFAMRDDTVTTSGAVKADAAARAAGGGMMGGRRDRGDEALDADDEPASVRIDREGAVAVLTLDDPERRNPLSPRLRDRLLQSLHAVLDDDTVRVVVVTGAGDVFCAGGDLTSMGELDRESGRARLGRSQAVVRTIVHADKPVIAAVEGAAAGAGLSLAASCDVVVAAADARFTAAFGQVGLMPDLGALWAVPGRVGVGTARRLLMLGDTVDGAEAVALGLADRLAEPGAALEAARAEAARLAEGSPLALRAIKRVLAAHPQQLAEVLAAEAELQSELFASDDLREGLAAFRQRRRPRFSGR